VFQISRVGSSSAAERYIESLKKDPEVAELIFCSDESLDYAVGEAKEQGQLNTWVSSLASEGKGGFVSVGCPANMLAVNPIVSWCC
jgi:hypothetical protein